MAFGHHCAQIEKNKKEEEEEEEEEDMSVNYHSSL